MAPGTPNSQEQISSRAEPKPPLTCNLQRKLVQMGSHRYFGTVAMAYDEIRSPLVRKSTCNESAGTGAAYSYGCEKVEQCNGKNGNSYRLIRRGFYFRFGLIWLYVSESGQL